MTFLRSFYYWTIALGYIGFVLLITFVRTFFESPEAYDPWLRRRLQTLFKLLNSDPVLEFAEELPTDQPLVFMANHSSLIDVPLLKAVIPYYFKGMLAHNQLDYFLYGTVVKRMGNIAIQRDNIRASLRSFRTAKDQLDNGIHIAVLPEGNRSLDGRLLPFKKLPFQFAKESGASIVPIAISGVFAMKNKTSRNLKPGSLIVRFAPLITSEMMAQMEIDDVMELTREHILLRLEAFEAGTD